MHCLYPLGFLQSFSFSYRNFTCLYSMSCHPFNLLFLCYFFITLPVSALHGCFSRALLDLPVQDPSFILAHWLVSAPRRGGWSLSDPAPLLWGCDFWASWACTSFQHFVFWGWSQPGIWTWHNLQLPPSKANGRLIIGVSFCRKYSEKIFFGSPHLNGKYHSEYI